MTVEGCRAKLSTFNLPTFNSLNGKSQKQRCSRVETCCCPLGQFPRYRRIHSDEHCSGSGERVGNQNQASRIVLLLALGRKTLRHQPLLLRDSLAFDTRARGVLSLLMRCGHPGDGTEYVDRVGRDRQLRSPQLWDRPPTNCG